jgi:YD repeat-containing protein
VRTGAVKAPAAGSGAPVSYGEDASGNITTLPDGASASYNPASELVSSTLGSTTTDYSYDADGERTGESVGSTTVASASYNGAGELTGYHDGAAELASATCTGNSPSNKRHRHAKRWLAEHAELRLGRRELAR